MLKSKSVHFGDQERIGSNSLLRITGRWLPTGGIAEQIRRCDNYRRVIQRFTRLPSVATSAATIALANAPI